MQSQSNEHQDAVAEDVLHGRDAAEDAVSGLTGLGGMAQTDHAQTDRAGNSSTEGSAEKDHGAVWRDAAVEGQLCVCDVHRLPSC